MNHLITHEQYRSLIRGEVIDLAGGDRVALSDIGYLAMLEEVAVAIHDAARDAGRETGERRREIGHRSPITGQPLSEV